MLISCPECHGKLHEGQHQYADGLFKVQYCKKCGFKKAEPSELKG